MPADMKQTDGRMSDDAVRAKTGRNWAEWFAVLDAAGAAAMTHKEIVALLSESYDVGPWWQQSVTVMYERERGLRDKHQVVGGYQISRSKTIAASAGELFARWSDEKKLRSWLKQKGITMRKTTPDKTVRFAFPDGTSVEVYLAAKGEGKTSVTVQHSKLSDADEAARMKEYWGEKLDLLKADMER